MAQLQEIRVPDIGDFDEVEVIEVLVAKGDRVEVEDPIVTLESDKATMELPSPGAGVVESVAVSVGDAVSEGSLLLVLAVEAGAAAADAPPSGDAGEGAAAPQEEATATGPAPAGDRPAEAAASDAPPGEPGAGAAPATQVRSAPRSGVPPGTSPVRPPVVPESGVRETPPHASPLVRRMARDLGVDLRGTSGSGPSGRVLAEDVKQTVRSVMTGGSAAVPAAAPASAARSVDFSRYGEIEQVARSKIRRVAARNLSISWSQIPHVTQHDEADVTELEALRTRYAARLAEEGVRLSPLLFVLKACAIALRGFPNVRSSLTPDGESLILKHYYHLGVAVDTEHGLVVPVVRDVDRKGVRELAVELAELAGRARERKLRPADFEGAVFSISSLGGIGGTAFTPIVNGPEVAILGLSRTAVKPVWDAESESFVPRKRLPLSFSYDHRVIDGAEAVRFTTELARLLGDPTNLLL